MTETRRSGIRLIKCAALVASVFLALLPTTLGGAAGNGNGARGWSSPVTAINAVVSSPTTGGGYHQPFPVPGGCGPGTFNANHSESEIAVRPGTDTLVGSSKFFFENLSSFYNFYLGGYAIDGLTGSHRNSIVQGYDCTTVGTQAMPPSWTNTTDPNVDFDTGGRAYQTMLPFNAFWTNLHPNGEITVSFSDDGLNWTTGNGGKALEQVPNSSSFSFHFEDKQWIAVNHFPTSPFPDHVYAVWDLGNSAGNAVEVREATSRDRGLTFSKAQTVGSPSVDQHRNAFPIATVSPDGSVYIAWSNVGTTHQATTDFFVTRSTDDAQTFSTPVMAATTTQIGNAEFNTPLLNTTFRDGVPMGFAASPDFPGHLYMTYEFWTGTDYDVDFVQSTNFGRSWSSPIKLNDNIDALGVPTDQWQPQVAAGPGGAVAVGFYDRRAACPNDASILRGSLNGASYSDAGKTNFCIDLSVQAFKDSGAGAAPIGANIRASQFTWDPQQPGLAVTSGGTADLQKLGGLGQMACSSHNDPCTTAFIGDYFGMAISGSSIYALTVSTHYPSSAKADDGSTLYYQQQVLSTISRAAAGI